MNASMAMANIRSALRRTGIRYEDQRFGRYDSVLVPFGSARIAVATIESGEGADMWIMVLFSAPVAMGVTPDRSLYVFLNDNQPLYGRYTLDKDDDGDHNVMYTYAMAAEGLTDAVFHRTLGVAAMQVDAIDDRIVSMYGGVTAG